MIRLKHLLEKPIPVIITVYKDKKFDFEIKSPPASHFIKEAAKLKGWIKRTWQKYSWINFKKTSRRDRYTKDERSKCT